MFRVSTFWWLYKGAKPFPSPLFLKNSFVSIVASIVRLDFLDAHGGYYMVTVYIHYMFIPSLQFNSILEKLLFVV